MGINVLFYHYRSRFHIIVLIGLNVLFVIIALQPDGTTQRIKSCFIICNHAILKKYSKITQRIGTGTKDSIGGVMSPGRVHSYTHSGVGEFLL